MKTLDHYAASLLAALEIPVADKSLGIVLTVLRQIEAETRERCAKIAESHQSETVAEIIRKASE